MSNLFVFISQQDFCHEQKFKEDNTILDIKKQLTKLKGIDFKEYFLFYNNTNLTSEYDNAKLSDFIKFNSNTEKHLFLLFSKEEYMSIIDDNENMKCKNHPNNIVYMYCSICNNLICDKCKYDSIILNRSRSKKSEEENQLPAEIEGNGEKESIDHIHEDKNIILLMNDSITNDHILKMYNENKYNINANLEKISSITNNDDFKSCKEEMQKEITDHADKLINIINEIKNVELSRLDLLIERGKNKLNEYKCYSDFIKKFDEKCQEFKNKVNEQSQNFKKSTNPEEKTQIIKDLHKQSNEIFLEKEKAESIVSKLKYIDTTDFIKTIKKNRDMTYKLKFIHMEEILEMLRVKINQKYSEEQKFDLYLKIEDICISLPKSHSYSQALNLTNFEDHQIYQSIDNKDHMRVFNFETKQLSEVKVVFSKEVKEMNITAFPQFSRSINIGGKLYVCGGERGNDVLEASFVVEKESIEYVAKSIGNMFFKRCGHTLLNRNNKKIYAISGAYGEKTCEYLDLETKIWHNLSPLKEDRVGTSVLLYKENLLYCFFGKRYNEEYKKWEFISSIERCNLTKESTMWEYIYFRNEITDNLINRAFSGLIYLPQNKILLVGGQIMEDFHFQLTQFCLEIDVEEITISPSKIILPKKTAFIDPGFYTFDLNSVQFSNDGIVFIHTHIFDEVHYITGNDSDMKCEKRQISK